MNDIVKAVVAAVIGFGLLEAYKADKAGRSFNLGNIPLVGQIIAPRIDPIADTTGSYTGTAELSMAATLAAIDANPGLVADLTPQGQYRIDPRQIG